MNKFQKFKHSFDITTGLDSLYITLVEGKEESEIQGFVLNSPLENNVKKLFDYIPEDSNDKCYKATWVIDNDKKLKLLFANGTFNGKKVHSSDLIPSLNDSELNEDGTDEGMPIYNYTGKLIMQIQQANIPSRFKPKLVGNEYLILKFREGKLLNKFPFNRFHSPL